MLYIYVFFILLDCILQETYFTVSVEEKKICRGGGYLTRAVSIHFLLLGGVEKKIKLHIWIKERERESLRRDFTIRQV